MAHGVATLALALTFVLGARSMASAHDVDAAVAAQVQAQPTSSPSAAPSVLNPPNTNPPNTNPPSPIPPKPKGGLGIPVIDIVPVTVFTTNGDAYPTDVPKGYQSADGDTVLNYAFSEQLFPRLNLLYLHNAATPYVMIGRFITHGRSIYPEATDDLLDDVGLSYTIASPRLVSNGGRSRVVTDNHGYVRFDQTYLHRQCCPAVNAPGDKSPYWWRTYYLEAQYRTTPITPMSIVASFTERATEGIHRPSATYLASLVGTGFTDSTRLMPGLTQTLGLQADIDPHVHKTTVFANFIWGAIYFFSNQPFPYYDDTFDYGFTHTFNRFWSVRWEVNNQEQRFQGYPFPLPNVLHRSKIMISNDLRIAP